MNLSLEGKNAVVCGSSQGIGLAVAVELALLGANCTLMARNEDALKKAIQGLDTGLGQQHDYLVVDFNYPDEVKKAIEDHVSKRPVHILVNNSGGPAVGPITEATEETFQNAFNQHLVCNHILAKAVISSMQAEKYGRIINIISISVKTPLKNLGVSNTIRWAVASWSKTFANEVGKLNITVNNILPGYTKTQRLETMLATNASKLNIEKGDLQKELEKNIPLQRFAGPEEIASVVAFVASPAASYVHGSNIVVDGGKTDAL